jgi:Flp pilus assembly CpaE family ATPase
MRAILTATLLAAATAALAANALDGVSNREAVAAVKLSLLDCSSAAAARLGAQNGFFSNEKVKIRLPPSLQRVEALMRATGLERQADELVLAMNRAAEASMPHAKALLESAVKKMKVQDPKNVLVSSDTGATDYLAAITAQPLGKKLLPVVKKTAAETGVVEKYNAIARHGKQLGLVKSEQIAIERYVTEKALAGLYVTIGEEEKALRKNPSAAPTSTVQKVFSALR